MNNILNLPINQLIEKYITKGNLSDHQIYALDMYKRGDRIINIAQTIIGTIAPRSSGITTLGLGLIVLNAIFEPNSRNIVFTKNYNIGCSAQSLCVQWIEDISNSVFAEYSIEAAPKNIFNRLNRTCIELMNGSKIQFLQNPDSVKGLTISNVFVDNSIKDNQKYYETAAPALVSTNGRMILAQ